MKTKRFITILLAGLAITTLAACRGGRGRGSDSSTSEAEPSSSGLAPTAVNPTSSTTSSSTTYTLKGVVDDINAIFNELIGEDLLAYNSQYKVYNGGLDLSEDGEDYSNTKASQDVLQPAAEFLDSYLPEYLLLADEHYYASSEDYWEDGTGDTVYEIALVTPDEAIVVDIITYCYEDSLIGQILVYEAEE